MNTEYITFSILSIIYTIVGLHFAKKEWKAKNRDKISLTIQTLIPVMGVGYIIWSFWLLFIIDPAKPGPVIPVPAGLAIVVIFGTFYFVFKGFKRWQEIRYCRKKILDTAEHLKDTLKIIADDIERDRTHKPQAPNNEDR